MVPLLEPTDTPRRARGCTRCEKAPPLDPRCSAEARMFKFDLELFTAEHRKADDLDPQCVNCEFIKYSRGYKKKIREQRKKD